MHIEINEKFLDELKHTAHKLRKAEKQARDPLEQTHDILDDIRSGYTLLESIVDSAEKSVDARPRIIKRENEETGDMHTHVVLTSFCISNEWLGDKDGRWA